MLDRLKTYVKKGFVRDLPQKEEPIHHLLKKIRDLEKRVKFYEQVTASQNQLLKDQEREKMHLAKDRQFLAQENADLKKLLALYQDRKETGYGTF